MPDPNGVSSIKSIATTSPGSAPRTIIGPAMGARGCLSQAGVKGVGTARMSSTSSNAPRTSTVNSSPESTVIVGGVWVLTKKRYSVRLALRPAAARADVPDATAAATRSRKSPEYGAGTSSPTICCGTTIADPRLLSNPLSCRIYPVGNRSSSIGIGSKRMLRDSSIPVSTIELEALGPREKRGPGYPEPPRRRSGSPLRAHNRLGRPQETRSLWRNPRRFCDAVERTTPPDRDCSERYPE